MGMIQFNIRIINRRTEKLIDKTYPILFVPDWLCLRLTAKRTIKYFVNFIEHKHLLISRRSRIFICTIQFSFGMRDKDNDTIQASTNTTNPEENKEGS
jgi:hypothetical protein